MKRPPVSVRVLAVALVLGAACASVVWADVSLQDFQARLATHGKWLVSARYGNVWQPSLARAGWNPYYDGHWEYTDVGQTWISDYAWGTIPYHYGTWALEPKRGWVWIPGDTWAPSWVVFRTGPDYIGWAPVAPGYVVGATGGPTPSAGLGAGTEEEAFVFVPSRQFFAPRVRGYVVPASRTTVVIKKTRIVQNTIRIENHLVVNRGPSIVELRRATGKPVRAARLESARCLEPGVGRREIRVDAARARSGVRAVAPSMARAPMPKRTETVARGGDARGAGDRSGSPRGGSRSASGSGPDDRRARTAYDRDDDVRAGSEARAADTEAGVERPRTTRIAHQDVYDRDARAPRSADKNPDDSVRDDESRSERDVRLLASREKQDRERARASDKNKPSRTKSRS